MTIYLKAALAHVFTGLALAASCVASGQKTVWDEPKKIADNAGRSTGRVKEGVARWKKHLLLWGLDSNYTKSLSANGRLNTNGWSLGLIYELRCTSLVKRRTDMRWSSFYTLSFSEVKHEKQTKQRHGDNPFPEFGTPPPFVFGKINNLYLLQIGYGREHLILPGVLEGNISVGFRYSGGFSLAMLKPYYLKLIHTSYTPDPVVSIREERYSDESSELFLDRERIFGGAGWKKGIDGITYVPGIFVEGAFILIPRKHKGFIQSVSFGGQFSAYVSTLPIMAEKKSYPFAGALFVGLSLGKRW